MDEVDRVIEAKVTDVTDRMILRESVANGSMDDYDITWDQALPQGLIVTVVHKATRTRTALMVSGNKLFRDLTDAAIAANKVKQKQVVPSTK